MTHHCLPLPAGERVGERAVALLLLLLLLISCTKPPAPAAPQVADAGTPAMTAAEVKAALELNCQSCHSLRYIQQQRLTAGQWTATLAKMRGWGSLLEEPQVPLLATALATAHGPSAALMTFPVEDVAPFAAEPAAPGDATRGKTLFDVRCLVCHGPDARGTIGVNITDRPILQQPSAFITYVKAGRGRMPPHPDLDAGQFGDLLAWLGTK